MRLTDAAAMRALDQYAIQALGIPGAVLMENAGAGTAGWMQRRWLEPLRGGISILCGRGNNGGDGCVIARHLHNAGFQVEVYLFAARDQLAGDAALQLGIIDRMGLPIRDILDAEGWTVARAMALGRPVVVDALLGTGLRSNITGLMRQVIEDINEARRLVMAVDIPSGLDASSGMARGAAIRATATTTYGLAKLGQVLEPALEFVGELVVVDISLPREKIAPGPEHDRLLEPCEIQPLLPGRPFIGHKGTFGHVLVVGGSIGKLGAAVLTCHAALRSGVGLVTLAVPRSAMSHLPGLWPEIMVEPIEDQGHGHFVPESVPALLKLLERKDALALGPGLSQHEGVATFVTQLISQSTVPTVVDADGLNALAGHSQDLRGAKAPLILSPHPGEAARLLGTDTATVQSDRVFAIRQLTTLTGATVVLKGARTLVANPAGRLSVNQTGNPGLGTGGTGDVLTGLIGGLLAQGQEPEDAAVTGVFLHGLAGDLAATELGGRAMIAGDVIAHLGAAFRELVGENA